MISNKIENFWYYNKWKIIVGLLAIITVTIITVFYGKGPEPDITLSYVTDGRTLPTQVEDNIKKQMTSFIQDVNNDGKTVMKFEPLIGMKLDMEITSPDFQILLINGGRLKKYAISHIFQKLNTYVDKFGIDISKNPEVKEKSGDVFVLPVSKINYLLNVGFPGDDYYLAILKAYDNKESIDKNNIANKIVEFMLKN